MALRFGDLRFGDLKSVDWAFSYLSDTPGFHPSGAGGGFNRFAHSAGPISRGDSAVAIVQ